MGPSGVCLQTHSYRSHRTPSVRRGSCNANRCFSQCSTQFSETVRSLLSTCCLLLSVAHPKTKVGHRKESRGPVRLLDLGSTPCRAAGSSRAPGTCSKLSDASGGAWRRPKAIGFPPGGSWKLLEALQGSRDLPILETDGD